jgi:hypothetical protein
MKKTIASMAKKKKPKKKMPAKKKAAMGPKRGGYGKSY